MSAATPLRIGQVNGAGADDALFLKVFGGEVMSAFAEANVMMDKHLVRSISSGKSAAFPATWKVSASYHTPGAEIVGQASNVNERVISIDALLLSDVFIPLIDEAKNHYDYRSEYSTQASNALAVKFDKNVLQVGVLAARATATVTGGNGGAAITAATARTDAAVLAGAIYDAAQTFDEKDIPEGDEKFAFVKPAQYYLMAQSTALINRDWMGAGSYSDGKILRIGGIQVVKTNHLPTSIIASAAGENNTYSGTFTNTAALVMTKKAVGTVKLLDLGVESQYDIRRQGTLIVAKYALGTGVLRPECAVEIKVA